MSTAAVRERAVADVARGLDRLWEHPPARADHLRGGGMPAELERRYGGPLSIPLRGDRPTVVANFVSTVDGVVAFGGGLTGGGPVSGHHQPDRFVMGLLRALADAVVVGAGTVRGSSNQRWIAEHIDPASAAAFGRWRHDMGLAPTPVTIVLSGSGDVPLEHPGLRDPRIPVVIATTPAGAERLSTAPARGHVSIEPIGSDGRVTGSDIVGVAWRHGGRVVVTEGGPHLLGELVGADLVDELFLTLAPQLVGRGHRDRLGLVEGLALAPADGRWHDLVSVRRSVDHLFLRYRRTDRHETRES